MASIDPPAVAPATAGEGEWQRQLALILLPALAIFAVCLNAPSLFVDGDTNWHVGAGRWILAHGAVPRVDPFSYTFAGKPWVAHEWGSEVLLALAYAASGWSGVVLITAAAAALTFLIVASEITPRLGVLTALMSLGLAMMVLWPSVLARPHMLALPVLALWLTRMLQARRDGRRPPLWLIPLMTVWANLHGSFIFGLAFTGFFGLEAVLGAGSKRAATLVSWGGFAAAAGIAALITPNGFEGLLFPLQVMLLSSLQEIGEWKSISFTQLTPFEVALLSTLFALIYRGVRIGAVRLLLLLLLLHMTLQHQRQQAILAVAAPLLLAGPLGAVMEPGRANAPSLWRAPMREIAAPLAVIAALFLGLWVWRVAQPVVRTDSASTPVTALAHVPATLLRQPVFNHYDFGGWLIFNGVPVFIDGRADMYGDAFVQNFIDVERNADPAVVASTFGKWKIAWAIIQPRSRLATLLEQTPGWRLLYADKYAAVVARDDVLAAPPR